MNDMLPHLNLASMFNQGDGTCQAVPVSTAVSMIG
ncbi:hypothetical protein SLEP1_g41065 [Rubroshorea leprosula]|uniref:Uncharacterized protein n=1 Tax=Rubroshorea leprosula TaxID=152421 RepID=A0AAV5L5B7_9ROSI|nr:hypothetical protein SLEP1_g41065 [Rubroshorea leprosula]